MFVYSLAFSEGENFTLTIVKQDMDIEVLRTHIKERGYSLNEDCSQLCPIFNSVKVNRGRNDMKWMEFYSKGENDSLYLILQWELEYKEKI